MLCALAIALPRAGSAQVTLAIGGGPSIGTHASTDGSVSSGAPVPLTEIDARMGTLALHVEGQPFMRTRPYGNPFDTSISTVQQGQAALRIFGNGHRVALGAGYGVLVDTTDRQAPRSVLRFEAGGIRLEAHAEMPMSSKGVLEFTVGGVPWAHGTLTTQVGIPGAADVHDPVSGSQFDLAVRKTQPLAGSFALAYGVRYVDQIFTFEGSTKTVENNNAVLPFLELRFKL